MAGVKLVNKDATFEFELLENVTEVDFSAFVCAFYSGVHFYWREEPGTDQRVVYEVDECPEIKEGAIFVTFIRCSDPEVQFMGGLSLKSGAEEVKKKLKRNGFKIEQDSTANGLMYRAKKGKLSVFIDYSEERINFVSFMYHRD